jgi:RES domain-containing protein
MASITVWRITDPQYVQTAFSGEGARIWGGRFNSPGTAAVYTSGSLSLALLENLVQTSDRSLLRKKRLIKATIPEHLVHYPSINDLPDSWDAIPAENASRNYGDNWIKQGKSPVLKVPSVVVPVEFNYVLNPDHPEFNDIQIDPDQSLPMDPRFFM